VQVKRGGRKISNKRRGRILKSGNEDTPRAKSRAKEGRVASCAAWGALIPELIMNQGGAPACNIVADEHESRGG